MSTRKKQELELEVNPKAEEEQQVVEDKKSLSLIYCGPTINGEIPQYAVFNNGIPEHLETHIKECPEIRNMFFQTGKLTIVRKKLSEQGSRENSLYKKISDYLKGVKQ